MMKYLLSAAFCVLCTLNICAQGKALATKIDSILQGKKATVGVAFIHNGKEWAYNNDHHYPLLSVCKYHLALCVLDKLSKTDLSLDTEIFVSKAELHPNTYSPLRQERPEGNFNMPAGELLRYSVALSDNNACDILFRFVGGPAMVQQYCNAAGFTDLSISVTEDQMHQHPADQYLNWATPLSAARAVDLFLNKELFTSSFKKFLEHTMVATSTGPDKLKALLPPGTVVGHKTGSSDRTSAGMKIADNDIGFVRTPKGNQYAIAIFVTDSMEDDKTNASIIANISRAIFDHIENFHY